MNRLFSATHLAGELAATFLYPIFRAMTDAFLGRAHDEPPSTHS